MDLPDVSRLRRPPQRQTPHQRSRLVAEPVLGLQALMDAGDACERHSAATVGVRCRRVGEVDTATHPLPPARPVVRSRTTSSGWSRASRTAGSDSDAPVRRGRPALRHPRWAPEATSGLVDIGGRPEQARRLVTEPVRSRRRGRPAPDRGDFSGATAVPSRQIDAPRRAPTRRSGRRGRRCAVVTRSWRRAGPTGHRRQPSVQRRASPHLRPDGAPLDLAVQSASSCGRPRQSPRLVTRANSPLRTGGSDTESTWASRV